MKFLLALLFCFSAIADERSKPLTTSRIDYTVTNVTTGAWVEVYPALPQPVNRIEIFDSSGRTMEIGFGPSGGETRLVIVFPGGNGPVPVDLPNNARISIRAVSATASSGEIDLNFYQ
jgi:hypothetical protein